MSDGAGLFDLPEFGHQEELLSLDPVARQFDSTVELPVARVLPDLPLAHMDRLFDYEIPEKYADVKVGARVRVVIGSREVDGFIVERRESTTMQRLRPIKRVVSNIGVLTAEVLTLCREIARRQACPVASAIRLAIPQRHARAEKEFLEFPPPEQADLRIPDSSAWDRYIGGTEFVSEFRAGRRPSAIVQLRARDRARDLLPYLIAQARTANKSALVVVPTPVMARSLAADIAQLLGEQVAVMMSDDDHASRYQTFLGVLTGRSKIVVGTRSAAWAPAQNLGLVALLDDHHSALREKRAPYAHAREVLAIRAAQSECSFVQFGFGPSPQGAHMVFRGQAQWITPAPSQHRSGVPHILSANDFRTEGLDLARMPSSVFSVTRSGLERGPVLFTVPRAGYIPMLACQQCREIASCSECEGLLAIPQPDAAPACTRCAQVYRDYRCQHCGDSRLRAVRIGSQRTAQEIGRAFKGTPIHIAGVAQTRGEIDASARIVVATPGTAPYVPGGYAAGIVLDSGYLLRSTNLESDVQFLRTITHVAAQIRPRASGGTLLIVGDVPTELINALHAWDMAGWAEHTLAERQVIGLPPAAVWVEVKGAADSVRDYLGIVRSVARERGYEPNERDVDALLTGGAHDVIPGMAVLGPNRDGNDVVVYLRYAQEERVDKTAIIYEALRILAARHMAPGLRVVVDPAI
ncbi:primosomal protein N' family DNA-binding protein [Trueperella bialowiezensis]|uniref:Primosomal protein N n=1 Tax=Trueperella bialowiezensis TaxID=312285 RepID=A0A3S4YWK3_9ACTO|nr:hypothetical protein [Trueperella bialowiezensis]VEI12441.1 Primosomal protein N' [Trueperella bialowiezensis]